MCRRVSLVAQQMLDQRRSRPRTAVPASEQPHPPRRQEVSAHTDKTQLTEAQHSRSRSTGACSQDHTHHTTHTHTHTHKTLTHTRTHNTHTHTHTHTHTPTHTPHTHTHTHTTHTQTLTHTHTHTHTHTTHHTHHTPTHTPDKPQLTEAQHSRSRSTGHVPALRLTHTTHTHTHTHTHTTHTHTPTHRQDTTNKKHNTATPEAQVTCLLSGSHTTHTLIVMSPDVSAQISKALFHLLNSGNILLDQDLVPKISDFGLTRASANHRCSTVMTGRIVGTTAYMAPEALRGEITPKSDVFSFGVRPARRYSCLK